MFPAKKQLAQSPIGNESLRGEFAADSCNNSFFMLYFNQRTTMNQYSGKHFKELRKAHGFSQKSLAEYLHVVRQAVSNWEREKNVPSTAMLQTLAELYGMSVTDVVNICYPPDDSEVAVASAIKSSVSHAAPQSESPVPKDTDGDNAAEHIPAALSVPAENPARTLETSSAPDESAADWSEEAAIYPPPRIWRTIVKTGAITFGITLGVFALLIVAYLIIESSANLNFIDIKHVDITVIEALILCCVFLFPTILSILIRLIYIKQKKRRKKE